MKKKLISATLAKHLDLGEIKLLQNQFGYGIISSEILYEVSIYKIIYNTTYIGEIIQASGVLMLPNHISHAFPILSIQNGTTFLKSEAASSMVSSGHTGFEFFASSGYITLVPDYIGYGESSSVVHPYYDAAHSATSVIDFLLSVQEYLHTHAVVHSRKLFMTGYSEGGYITLSVLKSLEQRNETLFEVTAVAAGAGGFDLFSMLALLSTGNTQYIQPAYIAYLIMAYEQIYEWEKPLEYYFTEKYAKLIPKLFAGIHDKQCINDHLGSNLKELFNPIFYDNLMGNGEMELKKALLSNSLSNWCPRAKLNLYHGLADDVIPYQNTEITFQKMIQNGAKQLQYISIPNATHHSTLQPMLELVKPWFDGLK